MGNSKTSVDGPFLRGVEMGLLLRDKARMDFMSSVFGYESTIQAVIENLPTELAYKVIERVALAKPGDHIRAALDVAMDVVAEAENG